MSGCLACKACTTQCPIKIDVPEFRSRFLQLYHTRYLRPVRDHLVATVETYAPLMARAPKTFNFFINQPVVRNLAKKTYRYGGFTSAFCPFIATATGGPSVR